MHLCRILAKTMTLKQQFPDISANMRAKLRLTQRNERKENPTSLQPHYNSNKPVTTFHQHEFRKLHITLLLIFTGGMAMVYCLLLNAPGIFRWMII
jgi:hypothetical protein